MHIVKKIKFKLFIPFSIGGTLILIPFLDNQKQIFALFLFYLITLFWLASMIYLVILLFPSEGKKEEGLGFKIGFLFLFKIILFSFIFSTGWQLMGKKLFISLMNLPLQAVIFALCAGINLKNRGTS